MPGSVSLHRVLKTSPEKLFRAFTEANAMAAWLPPYGFLCAVHEMNPEVGVTDRMSLQHFTTGNSHSFGGQFVEIKKDEFLKYTDQFEDPNLPGTMTTSVWMTKVSAGTDMKILQEGIPDVIPVEMCYLGWQESLDKLMRLVEPNIPDM